MNQATRTSILILFAIFRADSQGQIPHTQVVSTVVGYTFAGAQLEQYQESMLQGVDVFQEFLDPGTRDALRKSIERSYAPATLLAEVSRRCESQLTLPQLMTMLRWYESPVGSKISRNEHEAVKPASAKALAAFRAEEARKHRTQRRRLLLERLDAHQEMTTVLGGLLTSQLRSLLSQADAAIFGSPGTESVTLRRNIEAHMHRLEARHRDDLDVLRLFMYRHVTNNEIQQYNEFLESPEGIRLSMLLTRVIRETIEGASSSVRNAIASSPNANRR